MDKNTEKRRKELERLKWDYWNKSKAFKSFWKYFREIHIDKSTPLPDQFKPKTDNKNRKINHPIFSATREYWPYFLYKEPEMASFDEYWKKTMVFRNAIKNNEKKRKPPIEDYRELITKDIDDIVGKFKKEKKRKPTIDELKDCLVDWQMNPSCFVWLQIRQVQFTAIEAEERGKEVIRILKKRIVNTKPEIEPLSKYLTALKRKEEGFSYIEIFDLIINEEHYKDKRRQARRYVSNAEKIIRNLETGKNPWWCLSGRYSKISLWSKIEDDKLPLL